MSRLLKNIKQTLSEDTPQNKSKEDAEICYQLLGVSPTAPWKEIEKAYKTKAKVHHPDLGGDEDAMRALNEAYHYIKKIRKG
ncbi:MAG: J domain-containing protein [Candidatus Hydrogenedens sp.]|nr:J domain-containing protein [Candidatus Hydrogenedens sp.]